MTETNGTTTPATAKDYTTSGLKLEGAYENDRNRQSSALFKDIIREAYGVNDVICGHHLIYEVRDLQKDGFTYDEVQEIPSADALIFDHVVAQKIWGPGYFRTLIKLALEPVETRDKLLGELYYARPKAGAV